MDKNSKGKQQLNTDFLPLPIEVEATIDDLLKQHSSDQIHANFEEKKDQLLALRDALHKNMYHETKFQSWFAILDDILAGRRINDVLLSCGNNILCPHAMGQIPNITKIISDSRIADSPIGATLGDGPSVSLSDYNLDVDTSSEGPLQGDQDQQSHGTKLSIGGVSRRQGPLHDLDTSAAGPLQGDQPQLSNVTQLSIGGVSRSQAPLHDINALPTASVEIGGYKLRLRKKNLLKTVVEGRILGSPEKVAKEVGNSGAPSGIISTSSSRRKKTLEVQRNRGSLIIDDVIILPNNFLKKQIAGETVRTRQKKLPSTALGIWKYNNRKRQGRLFSAPLLHDGRLAEGPMQDQPQEPHENLHGGPMQDQPQEPHENLHDGPMQDQPQEPHENLHEVEVASGGPQEHTEEGLKARMCSAKSMAAKGMEAGQKEPSKEVRSADDDNESHLTLANSRSHGKTIAQPDEETEDGKIADAETAMSSDGLEWNDREHENTDNDDDIFLSYDVHGIKYKKDLMKETLMFESVGKWLKEEEYFCILCNPDDFIKIDGENDCHDYLLGVVTIPITSLAFAVEDDKWVQTISGPTTAGGVYHFDYGYYQRDSPIGRLERRVWTSSQNKMTALMHTRCLAVRSSQCPDVPEVIDSLRARVCRLLDGFLPIV